MFDPSLSEVGKVVRALILRCKAYGELSKEYHLEQFIEVKIHEG